MHTLLAARTDFSVGESILTIDHLIDEAKRTGQTAVALTDTMSVTAMIDFSKKAFKAGIKPIIGVRLRLVDDATWRPGEGEKKKNMPREYHVTAYVLTQEGVRMLFRLLTLANSEERFYYVSKLSFDDLAKELLKSGFRKDLAICLGDDRSLLEHPDAYALSMKLTSLADYVYAPLIPIDTPYYGRTNKASLDLMASNVDLKPLIIRPTLYEPGSADAQEIMTAVTGNMKVTDGWFRSRFNRDMHALNAGEMIAQMRLSIAQLVKRGVTTAPNFFREAALNTDALVEAVSYVWEKSEPSLPLMAPDEFVAVRDACVAGWATRFTDPIFGHKPTSEELTEIYKPRLAYELSILKKLGFCAYFLLVQDIVQYAKSNGILVGPGRGSVGGSLVAYLMGITECDPIRFGLMFERFINPDRLDLPDADLDFMAERRHEVIAYLITKYGQARVAGVSNFGTLGAASAMRDVGRVTGIPESEYSVSKLVPKLHGANVPLPDCRSQVPEIDSFANNNPGLWPIMERLEGTIRNFSQHAAGVVVGGVDIVERAVVENRKDNPVVCFDKTMVEEQGLVKVDILGLRTLDIIGLACDYIKERHGRSPDLSRIPLDDPAVLEMFANGKTTGIFQFESGGMRKLLKEMGVGAGGITFEDITAATALYRPGPMESGMMDSFYKRKQGIEDIDYDHPLMEPILSTTFGVIVYQEQVMKISQAIAGYNGADADKLRKIMGKKQPEEMKKERGKFVDGCVKTIGCIEQWAGSLFDKIEGFAGYGFNRSHSIEYSLISYQCMWLKTNYPVEFYAAGLTMMDSDKLPALIRDAKAQGISVDMPDINNSTDRFEIVTDTRLVIPFPSIKGISSKTSEAITTARVTGKFTSIADLLSRVDKRRCNVAHQEKLNLVGAFSRIEPGQAPADDPSRIKDQVELLPGLISANVPIHRDMHHDRASKDAIGAVIDDYRAKYGPNTDESDGMPVKPHMGKKARFMIISDAPGGEEDAAGLMGMSKSNYAVLEALEEAGLNINEAYWTALIKRPKRAKQVTQEEIALYRGYLEREIAILKPTVIVLLGSQVVRHFIPGMKGKASDVAGKVLYFSDLDANTVIGFSPGEIYHDPDKQTAMNAVFVAVAELLS